MTIEFDEAKHQYRVDGVPVPSVTQLVAPLGGVSGESAFLGEDYDEPDDDRMELTLEAAADRGTTMHAYIAHRLNGGAPEDFELPDAYEPYACAVELFLMEHQITPLLIETALPGVGFAGTPDLVCEFDGDLSILDYKFVAQIAKSKVGAQLAGYRALCDQNGIETDKLFAVQFLPDGTYRLYPVDETQSAVAFTVCQTLYDIKTKKHPRGRIE